MSARETGGSAIRGTPAQTPFRPRRGGDVAGLIGNVGEITNNRANGAKQKTRPEPGLFVWCREEDSNLHGVTRQYLKLVRLPIPPSRPENRRTTRAPAFKGAQYRGEAARCQ